MSKQNFVLSTVFFEKARHAPPPRESKASRTVSVRKNKNEN